MPPSLTCITVYAKKEQGLGKRVTQEESITYHFTEIWRPRYTRVERRRKMTLESQVCVDNWSLRNHIRGQIPRRKCPVVLGEFLCSKTHLLFSMGMHCHFKDRSHRVQSFLCLLPTKISGSQKSDNYYRERQKQV